MNKKEIENKNMSENSSSDSESLKTSTSSGTVNKSPVFDRDPELNELLTRKAPRFAPQAPKCAKCQKSVYAAEELRAANKVFHKLCFKCTACNKLLETNILTEHQGDLYCRSCYAKNYGPKGYGFGLGTQLSFETAPPNVNSNSNNNNNVNSTNNQTYNTNNRNSISNGEIEIKQTLRSTFSTYSTNGESLATNGQSLSRDSESYVSLNSYERKPGLMTFGGSDKCYRCLKNVYAAEKVIAAGKPFHKLCYNCFACKKLLNSMTCCDNSEGEIFCKSCYGKLYGPKGVGHGISNTTAIMPTI